MLLGSGELGREFAIAAKRLGCRVIACDRYANAPAMQVADAFEVFPMLDGKALRAAVEKHKPDVIVPEIEAIDTATLAELEKRRLARRAVGQGGAADHEPRRHPRLRRAASSASSPRNTASPKAARKPSPRPSEVGLPCVVKPVMSSSGKGQSTAKNAEEVGAAWDYAVANMRGDRPRVIVEEFIEFDSEITLLTVATKDGVLFCAAGRPPPGSRRLSRKLAAGGDPARGAAVGAVPGAQGRRGARRPRHLRRRILRSRRPGDLLRALARARTTPAW